MSLARKFLTAARLLGTGQFSMMRRQWKHNAAVRRLQSHGNRSFVHSDVGFPFVCHPDWPDSVDQYCGVLGENLELELARLWLRPADTVVDVGASLGLYTFGCADAVGLGGRVFAIEAAPYVHQKLVESVSLLRASQITPIHAALTGEPGTATFFVRRDNQVTAAQSLALDPDQREFTDPVTVPALTLTQIAGMYFPATIPALVKMDIEGAEASALAACPGTWLSPQGPLWILEINPTVLRRFGASPSEIVDRFPPAHFERWLLSKHPLIEGSRCELHAMADNQRTADLDLSHSLYFNFFALPRGSRSAERLESARSFLESCES